jgi:hypothetical protein
VTILQFKFLLGVAIVIIRQLLFIISGSAAQRGLWLPRHTRFLEHTQRRATVGRTPPDEQWRTKGDHIAFNDRISECRIGTDVEGNFYGIILGVVLQFPEEMEANHENLNSESSNLVLHRNRIS